MIQHYHALMRSAMQVCIGVMRRVFATGLSEFYPAIVTDADVMRGDAR